MSKNIFDIKHAIVISTVNMQIFYHESDTFHRNKSSVVLKKATNKAKPYKQLD